MPYKRVHCNKPAPYVYVYGLTTNCMPVCEKHYHELLKYKQSGVRHINLRAVKDRRRRFCQQWVYKEFQE